MDISVLTNARKSILREHLFKVLLKDTKDFINNLDQAMISGDIERANRDTLFFKRTLQYAEESMEYDMSLDLLIDFPDKYKKSLKLGMDYVSSS